MLGRLPSEPSREDPDDAAIFFEDDCPDPAERFHGAGRRRGSLLFEELVNMSEAEFFPPASPETLELLGQYGWTFSSATRRSLGGISGTITANPPPLPCPPLPAEQLEF